MSDQMCSQKTFGDILRFFEAFSRHFQTQNHQVMSGADLDGDTLKASNGSNGSKARGKRREQCPQLVRWCVSDWLRRTPLSRSWKKYPNKNVIQIKLEITATNMDIRMVWMCMNAGFSICWIWETDSQMLLLRGFWSAYISPTPNLTVCSVIVQACKATGQVNEESPLASPCRIVDDLLSPGLFSPHHKYTKHI